MIAALFVDPKGVYAQPGIDCWGEDRDARGYDGDAPVVAHPPCSRWCKLAGLVQARWGHKVGDDDGCFESALASVRRVGGVLEHPAYSKAWANYDLPRPPKDGGWQRAFCGGWVCHVEQGRYGHVAKKATWLYAFGTPLPSLRWGAVSDKRITHYVSWCGNGIKEGGFDRPRVMKKAAAATPPAFADVLISMARGVQ